MKAWPDVDNPRNRPAPGHPSPSRLDLLLLAVILLLFPPVGLFLLLISNGIAAGVKALIAVAVLLVWAVPVADVIAH
ncbi:MAG TPA: hypothetical protein VF137_05145 [Candidatus Dormibacteraeota bacterium]